MQVRTVRRECKECKEGMECKVRRDNKAARACGACTGRRVCGPLGRRQSVILEWTAAVRFSEWGLRSFSEARTTDIRRHD